MELALWQSGLYFKYKADTRHLCRVLTCDNNSLLSLSNTKIHNNDVNKPILLANNTKTVVKILLIYQLFSFLWKLKRTTTQYHNSVDGPRKQKYSLSWILFRKSINHWHARHFLWHRRVKRECERPLNSWECALCNQNMWYTALLILTEWKLNYKDSQGK